MKYHCGKNFPALSHYLAQVTFVAAFINVDAQYLTDDGSQVFMR